MNKEKGKIVKRLNSIFLKSKLFSPNGSHTFEILKYIFDEGLTVSDAFDKVKNYIEDVEGIRREAIDLKQEINIIAEIKEIILSVSANFNGREWITEDEIKRVVDFLTIMPYDNTQLQIGILDLLFAVGNIYIGDVVIRSMKIPGIPKTLEVYWDSEESLIDVSTFKSLETGFFDSKSNVVVYPDMDHELKFKLLSLNARDNKKFTLKVKPLRFSKIENYSNIVNLCEERMFGMPFSPKNFKTIFGKNHGEYKYLFVGTGNKEELIAKAFYVPLNRLEYVLKPYEGDQISLSLEEVIDTTLKDYSHLKDHFYTQSDGRRFLSHKYLHTIINRNTADISHLDMSQLIYYDSKIYERGTKHIKDKAVSADIKNKIFRIDGILKFEDFSNIASSAMDAKRNPEVIAFFNGQ
jgi:hypothetical protein